MDRAKNNPHLLPVSVIEAAAGGNVDAINAVLKHYENGVPHLCVDDEMRKTLEIKLITRILNFEIIKAA